MTENTLEEVISNMTDALSIFKSLDDLETVISVYLLSKRSDVVITKDISSLFLGCLMELTCGDDEILMRMLAHMAHVTAVSIYAGKHQEVTGQRMTKEEIWDIGHLHPEELYEKYNADFGCDLGDVSDLIQRNYDLAAKEQKMMSKEDMMEAFKDALAYKPERKKKDDMNYR